MPRHDADARLVAMLLAIDPRGLKGAVVHGRTTAMCEPWMQLFFAVMPDGAPHRRVPSHISDERLLGGLDLSATLAIGRPVCEPGVLAAADGGSIALSAATTRAATFAHVARALDDGYVAVERDGFSARHDTTFAALIATGDDDDAVPAPVADRVAFHVDMDVSLHITEPLDASRALVAAARARASRVTHTDASLVALTDGAARLGIASPRVVLLALAAARAHAALLAHEVVDARDLACAARLVYAPRATAADVQDAAQTERTEAPNDSERADTMAEPLAASAPSTQPTVDRAKSLRDAGAVTADTSVTEGQPLSDVVVRAAVAALPSGLVAAVAARAAQGRGSAGRAGAMRSGTRGRQIGTLRGDPRGGARLDLVATLRASLPWQRLRRHARSERRARLVELRRDDFRIRRCATPATTSTLFVVDASGSSALHRLSEAKGAVELMLAEGYARRDRVAVIAFRGTVAELVLPATHALARARRAIAGMPAGGGTPLATALDLAARVALQMRRDGGQVTVVVLTDGRANVARDGRGGRPRAEADATDAATRLRALALDAVWVDTSVRPDAGSRAYAQASDARYVWLPASQARGIVDSTRAARTA